MDPNYPELSMDLNMRLFKLTGLLQMITSQSLSLDKYKFYVMQLSLLLIFYAVLLTERVYDYYFNTNDLGTIIYKSTIVVTCTEACIKSLFVYKNRETMQRLIHVFHTDFLLCQNFNKGNTKKIIMTSTNKINYVIKYCEWIITSTMAVWVLYPLVLFVFSGTETLSVLDSWFPFDQTVSPVRECIYIIESFVTLYTGYTLTTINGYFLTMVAAVSTQINVLKTTLVDLKSISQSFVGGSVIINTSIGITNYNIPRNTRKDRINDEMEKLFRMCIIDHQKILWVCGELEKLLNPIALLQVLASTISLCFIPIMIVVSIFMNI
uniref:Odorant receptor 5 n=1 Tax=Subpsaltria yangi TaxID=1195109 RepID=A0A385IUR8_9HEMI|nr:odorant receptor 5 [Subpsaltria yangi]